MCFSHAQVVFLFFFFFFSWMVFCWHRCTQLSLSSCFVRVTPVSPCLLHPGWSQKLNGAEWAAELWFFSTFWHLPRNWKPFNSLFSCLTEWIRFYLLLHLLSRQVHGWMGDHHHGDWNDDTLHTQTDRYTHSLRFSKELSFICVRMDECLSKPFSQAELERQADWDKCSHPSSPPPAPAPPVWTISMTVNEGGTWTTPSLCAPALTVYETVETVSELQHSSKNKR